MKKYFLILLLLLITSNTFGYGIVDNKTSGHTSEDSLAFEFPNPDSLGQPLGGLDTTKILVTRNGDSTFAEIIVGVTGRISRRSTGNGVYDTTYYYEFQIDDVDGDGTLGVYTITILSISNETGAWLRWRTTDQFQIVTSPLSESLDSSGIAVLNTIELQDSVNVLIDSIEAATVQRDELLDSINVMLDSLETASDQRSELQDSINVALDSLESISFALDAVRDSLQFLVTAVGFSTHSAADIWTSLTRTLTTADWTTDADLEVFDTLIYQGCVWIDSASGNTSVDFGVGGDGTQMNPVSTFTAARAVADSFNCKKYCIIGKGTYSIPSAHVGWVFQSINQNTIINMNNQNIDGSTITGAHVIGQQGNGTLGIYATFFQCTLDSVSNLKADAWICVLNDTIDLRTNTDTRFFDCKSNIAGNLTPVINFGAGSVDVVIRNYYGGVEIANMNSNDNFSIELVGQLIVGASCNNAPITVRGIVGPITDNGTNTIFTDIAALNVEHIAEVTEDSVWTASNRGIISKQTADSIIFYDITGSFPNGTLGKFLKTIGSSIVRVENSQGMWNGKPNHVLLDDDATGTYDPATIRNSLTGETHWIIEHDTVRNFVTTFRDFKVLFEVDDEYVIESNPGLFVSNDGRVRGATENTVYLNPLADDTTDIYKNQAIYFSGGQGQDGVYKIKSYTIINSDSSFVTLYDTMYTMPDTFTSYVIIPNVDGVESRIMDSLRAEGVIIQDTTITGKFVGLMPDDWTAADSVAFQGAGSSLTLDQIALIVDSILSANHGNGSWLTVGAGGGPNTVIVYTIDTTTNDTLSGINIFVENLTGAPEASGPTNVSGFKQFGLTAEQWNFKAGSNKTTYGFDDTTFFITTNPDTFSISGYPIIVTPPVNPDLVRVFGRVLNIGAIADSGAVVTAFLKAGIKDLNENIVGPKKITTTTDVNGDFFLDIIPSPLLDSLTASPPTEASTKYWFEIRRTDGRVIKVNVLVPDSGTWNLTW